MDIKKTTNNKLYTALCMKTELHNFFFLSRISCLYLRKQFIKSGEKHEHICYFHAAVSEKNMENMQISDIHNPWRPYFLDNRHLCQNSNCSLLFNKT